MILKKLYTAAVAGSSVILFLLLLPGMLFSLCVNNLKMLFKLHRFWIQSSFFLAGITIQIRKCAEEIPAPCVYVANHFSSLDNLAIYLLIPEPFSVIGLSEVGEIPVYGRIFKRMHILMDRNSKGSRIKAMLRAGTKLKERIPLAIAIEGGIRSVNPPNIFQPFEDGAFILAVKNQVPLVPLVFKTTYQILPEFPLSGLYRVPFEAEVLSPIPTEGLGMKDLEYLKEEVFKKMSRSLQGLPVTHANLEVRSRWNLIREFR